MRGVEKRYGARQVLARFDASLGRGELVALEGRSGSGKTTILHLLAGLERPDSGSIEVAGRELTNLDREQLAAHRRHHIGWVGQEPGLIPFATALENATLALELRDGGRRAEHEPAARAWLERLGLGDCVDRAADRLSAGERQRVAIARALARGPEVLLLDEPTARLDEVCATHDRGVAERADRVLALEAAG
jgi:ABC-type lipoprotein export system ATPase subunit